MDNKTIKQFRTIGHKLSPVVIIANGLSDNINAEINRALSDHELIKIKVHANDRESRAELIDEISKIANADVVQTIGQVALLYRKTKTPDPRLSNLLRHKQ